MPVRGGGRLDTYLERTATSDGTPLTVSSTNTKAASFTTVIDPVPFAVRGFWVNLDLSVAGSPSALVDIAIGAASSEVIIVPDLLVSSRLGHPATVLIPLQVPAGARLSARCQCTSTTNIPRIAITLAEGPPGLVFGAMNAHGVATGDSGGQSIDPGGSANTKPAAPFTQIVASTTFDYHGGIIAFAAAANTAMTDANWLVEVGIGASSSERVVVPDIHLGAQTASDVLTPPFLGPFLCSIPAGSRISARAQCSITDATDRLFDIAFYGLR